MDRERFNFGGRDILKRVSRRKFLVSGSLFAAGFVLACRGSEVEPNYTVIGFKGETRLDIDLERFEYELLEKINFMRWQLGLTILALDSDLLRLARLRSADMARRNYFSHTSPDGQNVFSMMEDAEYPYGWAGENLARNNYSDNFVADGAFRGWMNSPGHRANMLHGKYSRFAVGWAQNSDGANFLTGVFADFTA